MSWFGRRGKGYVIAVFLALILWACGQELVTIPGRLIVSDIRVDTQIEEGTRLQNISLIYGYYNGVFKGALELPATFNLSSSGVGEVLLFAGINENGIQSSPVIYPFFDPFQTTIELEAGQDALVTPRFTYQSEVKFRLIDDFEGGTLFTNDLDGDPNTVIIAHDGLENQGGLIQLDANRPFIEVSNKTGLRALPIDGTPVFVELHYKSNIEFQIGLIGWSSTIPKSTNYKISIRPKAEWNKIYINFTPEIQNSQFEFYQLVLKADHDESLISSRIYLDNIKWLHL